MDRLSDTRSLGSGRSRGKQRLPLPSQQGTRLGDEIDLLSQFSDSQPSKSGKSSKRNLPLPSEMGDLGADLLSSLVSSGKNILAITPFFRRNFAKLLKKKLIDLESLAFLIIKHQINFTKIRLTCTEVPHLSALSKNGVNMNFRNFVDF